MAITVKPLADSSKDNLLQAVRQVFLDLEDQLNAKAQIYSNTTGLVPDGLVVGDILVSSLKGKISIRVKNTRGFDALTASMLGGLTANSTNFLGLISKAGAPTAVASFPNTGDWGFYRNTSTGDIYLCINFLGIGTLNKIALV